MTDSTELRISLHDGALSIVAKGLVTRDTIAEARLALLRAAYADRVERVLFDFSRAVLLLTPAAWEDYARQGLTEEFVPIPSGLLVPRANIDAAWNFCDVLNAHGRAFVAFTNAQDAAWWLQGRRERRRLARPQSAGTPLQAEPLPSRRRVSEPRD